VIGLSKRWSDITGAEGVGHLYGHRRQIGEKVFVFTVGRDWKPEIAEPINRSSGLHSATKPWQIGTMGGLRLETLSFDNSYARLPKPFTRD